MHFLAAALSSERCFLSEGFSLFCFRMNIEHPLSAAAIDAIESASCSSANTVTQNLQPLSFRISMQSICSLVTVLPMSRFAA